MITLVTTKFSWSINHDPCQNIYLQAYVIAMNYAFVVDKATHFCSFDYHDTAPPKNVIKNLEVYFLQSMSPAISTIYVANQFSLSTFKAQTHFESSSEISQDSLHNIPMLLSWIGQESTINTNRVLYLLVYIPLDTSSFQQLRHMTPCPSQNFQFHLCFEKGGDEKCVICLSCWKFDVCNGLYTSRYNTRGWCY
jgi:hypothetical protein